MCRFINSHEAIFILYHHSGYTNAVLARLPRYLTTAWAVGISYSINFPLIMWYISCEMERQWCHNAGTHLSIDNGLLCDFTASSCLALLANERAICKEDAWLTLRLTLSRVAPTQLTILDLLVQWMVKIRSDFTDLFPTSPPLSWFPWGVKTELLFIFSGLIYFYPPSLEPSWASGTNAPSLEPIEPWTALTLKP